MNTEAQFIQRYNNLNQQQRQAVDTLEGPVLVIAGPGSGKTELLSLRVANILRQTDTEASSILCLTFTDAAAMNMRTRLAGLIGPEAYKVGIYTFHSFATSIINRYPEHFYKGVQFNAADDLRRRLIITEILDGLTYDHPLKVKGRDGYQYATDILQGIAHLKKSGLTPEEFESVMVQNQKNLAQVNPLLSAFDQTMSLKAVNSIQDVVLQLAEVAKKSTQIKDIFPLPRVLMKQLTLALNEVEITGKATALSNWKKNWTYKSDDGQRVLKDTKYIDKHLGLAELYKLYQQRMQQENYYDYDDMLLDVLQALQHSSELRFALQEHAQFVLVDEFQDTNNAQMQLISHLTTGELQGDRPNIMAVGDDDQAIYKFQGAEVGNIIDFGNQYTGTKIIVLTQNYRSTQPILDVARQVITLGSTRLEDQVEEITKELLAANKSLTQGQIAAHDYATELHELQGVARRVEKLLSEGVPANEIAIIGRRHRDLQQIVPFLQAKGIPIIYEKQQDILQEPLVQQLVQIVRFAITVNHKQPEADDLLPEILSYPFWGLNRIAVWQVSTQAYRNRTGWLEAMLSSQDNTMRQIAEFLINLGAIAASEPIDRLLETIMGAHQVQLPDDEDGELDDPAESSAQPEFVSPFKEYYFSRQKFENNRGEYIQFLSALKGFVRALHEHQPDSPMKAQDLIKFIDEHQQANLPITNTSPFASAEQAVNLLTAHGAKGLEFDSVFILHCQEEVWAKEGRSFGLVAPINVALSSAASEHDDFLRLFYVALSRAKRNLFMSSYLTKESGKQSVKLSFIANRDAEIVEDEEIQLEQLLETTWHGTYRPPLVRDEQLLLLPLVEQYKMSVTHFNNFLDVVNGGPQLFLEQNLLRFPQPKVAATAYGTAVHDALREFYIQFKQNKVLPTSEELINEFERQLARQWLPQHEYDLFLARGKDELQLYYEVKSSTLSATDEIEFNFNDQQVMVEHAQLTGKIDRIVYLDNKQVSVHDIKTGHPASRWTGSSDYQKTKLHKYRYQLQFYKILIEKSRQFGGKLNVAEGMLEFLEPQNGKFIELPVSSEDYAPEALDRLQKLIIVVYDHIQQLNFPDTSDYEQSLAGILQFEEDLLDGKI